MAPAIAQPADTLRVGVISLPPGRGNPYKGVGSPHIYVWSALFDSLTFVDESGASTPALAASWQNVDPNTWRFTLRRGIKFQNGESFDANAVKVTMDYVTSEAGLATAAGRNFKGYSLNVIDDFTIEVRTEKPSPIVPNVISSLAILAPQAWTDLGDEGFTQAPVGTGSYSLVRWTPDRAILAGFAGSWRPPIIPNIEVIELPERPARLQALLSGQIDIMLTAEPDNFAQIEAAGHRVDLAPSPQAFAVALIQAGAPAFEPFKDRRVRQALNYAVDKETIARELLRNTRRISAQPATANAFGFDESLAPYPYDPDKARALLAEAGYANGFKFVMENVSADLNILQRVAQDLKQVGVEVEIVPVTFPDWLKKFLANTWESQSFNHVFGVAPELDAGKPMGFNSCLKPNPWYCDEAVMPLVEQVNTEFDSAKRKALLHQLMRWYHEEAPAIYLFDQVEMNGIAARVKNFKNINRAFNYHEMTLAN